MIFTGVAVFWLLAIMLFYFFIYQWQDQQILVLKNTVALEKQKTLQIENFLEKYPDISKYEQEIQNKIDLLNMRLPNNDGMAQFLVILENTAKKTGVKISNIKPNLPANKNNIAEYNIEIFVHGSYFQLLDFLKAMEDIPRFNLINTIDLQAQNKDQILSSKIILSIFQYGNVNTKSAAEAAAAQDSQNKSDLLTGSRANKPQLGVKI